MKNIIIIIKGFIMGIANLIPGVSGGTIALILGIYEKLINILKSFWKDFKNNIKFIFFLGLGIIIALVIGSKLINYSLDKFPLATILMFSGLIIGGLPLIFKKIEKKAGAINVMILILVIVLVVSLSLLGITNSVSLDNVVFKDYLLIFIVGFIAAGTMIIPGISGSLVLMMLGYYDGLIDVFSNITDLSQFKHNISILIPFGIGVLIGIIFISQIISLLLKKWPIPTYFAIAGFVLASIFSVLYEAFKNPISPFELSIGIILAIIGAITTYKLSIMNNKEEA